MKIIEKLFNKALILSTGLCVEIDSSFSLKWNNQPWGAGGLIPAGPPWNMVGPYDFDGDGFGDFIVSSSYAGSFCNGVYHYEAAMNDSIELKWVYTFYDLSCDYDAYSSVAVGDIDGDGNQEVLSLVDTSPGVLGQEGLQIFEWDQDSLSFLSSPTYTWNMGLDSVWEAAQIHVEDIDNDLKEEIIVSIMDGPWTEFGLGGSSRLMIFELDTTVNDSAIFNIEYEDTVWTNWSGYNISVGDLDNDSNKEIYSVGYEFFHLIVHEATGQDMYQYQTDFFVASEQAQRANQGIIIIDIDNDGLNEMFCATSGVNSLTGELINPGSIFAIESVQDVSSLSYANFNFITSYVGGIRQINYGDSDNDGNLNIYIAGHYDESIYDLEYNGGDPLMVSSYSEKVIFMDDTTDNYIPDSDQGKLRIAKLFPTDLDNDGLGDVVFTSASFATDKPHIFMIEHSGLLRLEDRIRLAPEAFYLGQNFPNPFNPKTAIEFYLPKSEYISLLIYDLNGKMVRSIYQGRQKSGQHLAFWDGYDDKGGKVACGIYFCKLTSDSWEGNTKMILTK